MKLCEYIESYIAEKGISQRELARQCGLSPQTITNIIKSGKIPDTATLTKLSNGMGCQRARFLNLDGIIYIEFIGKDGRIENPVTRSDGKKSDMLLDLSQLSEDQRKLIENVLHLTDQQRSAVLSVTESFLSGQ